MASFLNRKWTLILSIVLLTVIVMALMAYFYIHGNIASGGAKINEFLNRHCKQPAVFDPKDFKWTQSFRDNWKTIMKEFDRYHEKFEVPAYKDINEGSSAGTEGWKALFLRVFNNDTELIEHFPETMKLINSCPCTTAYFSMVEPGTHIKPHKGVYAGVLRYHLSLIAPRQWENCFIIVDGKKLHWGEPGRDVMFDDMYLHEVQNNTVDRRMVLFLDIKRDFGNPLINLINTIMLKFIKSNDVLVDTVRKANRVSKAAVRSNHPTHPHRSSGGRQEQRNSILDNHPMFSGLL